MGRGDLIRGTALLAMLGLAPPAGAASTWGRTADGTTTGAPATRTVAYRLLTAPKSDLSRPYPTHVVVDLA